MRFQLQKVKKMIEQADIKRKLRMVAEVPAKIIEKLKNVKISEKTKRAVRLATVSVAIAATVGIPLMPLAVCPSDYATYKLAQNVHKSVEGVSKMLRARDALQSIEEMERRRQRMQSSANVVFAEDRAVSPYESFLVVSAFLSAHSDKVERDTREFDDMPLAQKVNWHSKRYEKNPTEYWAASKEDREYAMIRMVNKALRQAGGEALDGQQMNKFESPTRCLAKLMSNVEKMTDVQRGTFTRVIEQYHASMEKELTSQLARQAARNVAM